MDYEPLSSESRLPLPDYDAEQRAEKGKKILFIVLLTVIALGAFFYFNPLKTTPKSPAQPGATVAAGAWTEWKANEPTFLNFDKRTYSTRDYILSVEHSLGVDDGGRRETFVVTNEGNASAELTLIKIVPRELYDNNYTANSSILKFEDAAPTTASGAVIESEKVTLPAGSVFTTRVWSSSTKQVGVLFIPVASKNVNATELKALFEQAVSEGKINLLTLTPQNADALSNDITRVLNDDVNYPTWADKKTQLQTLLSNTERQETAASQQLGFTATASEALPASYIEIPLFQGSESEQKLGAPMLKGVEGELAPYVAAGYPKIATANGIKTAQILFDLRKVPVSGGVFWSSNGYAAYNFTGTLVMAFSKNPDAVTRIPLQIDIRHVLDPRSFLSVSPALVEIGSKNEKTKKPLFVTNSYEFPVTVSGCGFKDEIQPHQTKYVWVTNKNAGCQVLQNGLPLQNEVLKVKYASDRWVEQDYDVSSLIEVDDQYNGRECIDYICSCDALKDFLDLRLLKYEDELTLYYRNYEAAQRVLGPYYSRTFTVLGTGLDDCEFDATFNKAFQGKTTGLDAAYAVTIKAKPLADAQTTKQTLNFEVVVEKILEAKRV